MLATGFEPPRFASVSDRDGPHHPRARAARRDRSTISRSGSGSGEKAARVFSLGCPRREVKQRYPKASSFPLARLGEQLPVRAHADGRARAARAVAAARRVPRAVGGPDGLARGARDAAGVGPPARRVGHAQGARVLPPRASCSRTRRRSPPRWTRRRSSRSSRDVLPFSIFRGLEVRVPSRAARARARVARSSRALRPSRSLASLALSLSGTGTSAWCRARANRVGLADGRALQAPRHEANVHVGERRADTDKRSSSPLRADKSCCLIPGGVQEARGLPSRAAA